VIRRPVVDDQIVATAQNAARHPAAHAAKTDEADPQHTRASLFR